jgi:hypothetical protein
MVYVGRDREDWDVQAGDILLFYKDYRDRSPGQPLFTLPVDPESEPTAVNGDVNWQNEGF